MKQKLLSYTVAAVLMNAGAASATVVYSNDFQSAVGSEWTTTFGGGLSLDHTAADGNRLFLGRSDGETNGNVDTDPAHLGNGNDVLRLAVNALPTHTKIQLAFDVYAIHSWDGNGPLGNFNFGPDQFGVTIAHANANTPSSFITTFSNVNGGEAGSDLVLGALQSFPDPFPTLPGSAPFSGSLEHGTLGYDFFGGGPGDDDSVYRITLTFAHTGSDLQLSFFGVGLQDLQDESWGLDNVQVSAVPLPAPLIMLVSGLAAALPLRRKSRRPI